MKIIFKDFCYCKLCFGLWIKKTYTERPKIKNYSKNTGFCINFRAATTWIKFESAMFVMAGLKHRSQVIV